MREGDQLGRLMLLYLLFGWVTLPLMYLFSYLFVEPAAGFTRMIIVNVITGQGSCSGGSPE